MTDTQLEEIFNVNERFEDIFSSYLTIPDFKNYTSVEQEDEAGPRIILQNLITGATSDEVFYNGEMEQLGINCELLISIILDRQDSDLPDLKKINAVVAQVRVMMLRQKIKSITFPPEYLIGLQSFKFTTVGHAVNDNNQDIITLQFSYPVYVQLS